MSDFWIMQWAKMREEQMEQEARRERLARLALARRRRSRQGLVKTCLFRLGKVFEVSGRFLQERFGPKPAGTCCKC
jgi:hypothetical protein